MPPRYAYWTILVDDQPTAFRSGSQEELMPTFKRLQQKHASAKMMWWQNGKLWDSRLDAQEAMRARGDIGRRSDPRQDDRRRPFRPASGRPSERPPGPRERREERNPSGTLDWKPKGEDGAPSFRKERSVKPAWTPKSQGKPEWKPKGSFKPERSAKPDWKPRGSGAPKRSWAPKAEGKLEWSPKSSSRQDLKPASPEKRKWVPKAEYKKSQGIEAKKDKNWRPGGEHKDPRQKYKDAKKAKWGRFKQTVRKRWESKGKKNDK